MVTFGYNKFAISYMKLIFCFILIFFTSLLSIAQNRDIYQSPDVIKKNNVKSRIIMFGSSRFKSRAMVDVYDHEGFITEHLEYDTTGLKCRFRAIFTYDSTHKLIDEKVYTGVYKFDSANKQFVQVQKVDTLIVNIFYDSLNRISKKTYNNPSIRFRSEKIYKYDPIIEIYRRNISDSSFTEEVTYFEIQNIEKKIEYSKYSAGLGNLIQRVTFENSFDKIGRLENRMIHFKIYNSQKSENQTHKEEDNFEYMKNGLLLKKNGIMDNDPKKRFTQLFDYKFWD
jgi:hypothetical protein